MRRRDQRVSTASSYRRSLDRGRRRGQVQHLHHVREIARALRREDIVRRRWPSPDARECSEYDCDRMDGYTCCYRKIPLIMYCSASNVRDCSRTRWDQATLQSRQRTNATDHRIGCVGVTVHSPHSESSSESTRMTSSGGSRLLASQSSKRASRSCRPKA